METDKKSPVFEETFRKYLAEMRELDFENVAKRIGAELRGGAAAVPLFGREHLVSPDGISGPDGGREPVHAEKVTLCRYFLRFPDKLPKDNEYTSYREFADAAPFVGGFKTNAELPIARNFGGWLDALRKAARALGGADPGINLGYDLEMRFQALPHVPVILLFNDQDNEFPASALILFERSAEVYLDMECLAILGWLLADYLLEESGGHRPTIM